MRSSGLESRQVFTASGGLQDRRIEGLLDARAAPDTSMKASMQTAFGDAGPGNCLT